ERLQPLQVAAGGAGCHRHRQLGGGGGAPGLPVGRFLDVAGGDDVQQDRGQVHSRQAVDHAVVDLGDDREPALGQALDHPQLPQRLGAVELLGDDAPRQLLQLIVGAGSGEAGVAYVVVEVDVVVVDPNRRRRVGDERQALAVAGDVLELRFDVAADPPEVDAAVGPPEL